MYARNICDKYSLDVVGASSFAYARISSHATKTPKPASARTDSDLQRHARIDVHKFYLRTAFGAAASRLSVIRRGTLAAVPTKQCA